MRPVKVVFHRPGVDVLGPAKILEVVLHGASATDGLEQRHAEGWMGNLYLDLEVGLVFHDLGQEGFFDREPADSLLRVDRTH